MESVEERRFVTALTRWARWWTFAGRVSNGWDTAIGGVTAGSVFILMAVVCACDDILRMMGNMRKWIRKVDINHDWYWPSLTLAYLHRQEFVRSYA